MPARFTIDPALATLLGESYRSSESAIKELVDNAWDADATEVSIQLPKPMTSDPIVVQDNGSGMTTKELVTEYLRVGSGRRTRKGERTPLRNRPVKGRKGIGKFAGLLAADVMFVDTKARGVFTQLRLDKYKLLAAQKSQENLEGINLDYTETKCDPSISGTTIILSNLNQNLSFPNPEKLRQLLMLEYGRKLDFKIYVDGNLIDFEDIPGRIFSEEIELPDIGKVRLKFTISDTNLKQSGIAVRVQDKVVGKPGYFGLHEDDEIPSKLLKRVYGEIEADGLSDDVTADWGAIIENSKAFQEISQWASVNLKDKVETTFRQEITLQKARHQKQINEQLAKLPEHRREFARLSLERVMQRFYGESEEKIAVLISVILETFEKNEYWTVIQNIEEAKQKDVEAFAGALDTFGLVDMAIMAQQAKMRIQFLDELDDLSKNSETLEHTMHTALENNIWVFGTEYSLMASNKTLARTIEDYTGRKFSGDRARKRPDLFFAHDIMDRNLLVEFKRPSHKLTRKDENQAEEYRDDLTPNFGMIDIIVVGGTVDPNISAHYNREGVKLLSYSSVISRARTQLDWLIKELTQQ